MKTFIVKAALPMAAISGTLVLLRRRINAYSPANLLLVLLLPGCMPAPETQLGVEPSEAEIMANVVIDSTGSFRKEMFDDGRGEGPAYKVVQQTFHRYFRSRPDSKDRLVVTHLCGSKQAVIFDAEPATFQRKFPDAGVFRDWILGQPDPGGSRVFEVLRDACDYMVLQHRDAPKLKSILLIFSDMENTVQDDPQARERFIESLRRYQKVGGVVAVYGLPVSAVAEWGRVFDDVGFKRYLLEPAIRLENARLPLLD